MPNGSDVFHVPGFSGTNQLYHLRSHLGRPVSSSFGYGGQLVLVENLPATIGRNQTSTIYLQKVVMETGVVERGRQSASVMSDVTGVAKPV